MNSVTGITAGVQLWPQHVRWSEVTAAATAIDSLGYHALWTWDHFYPHVGRYRGPNFESWTMMTALAAYSTRVRLGVLVSAATYRHPSLVAYQAATLDHVSQGRAAVGLGAGWFKFEHERLGFPLGSTQERLARLRESAHIVRGLLQGEEINCDGQFFRLKQATLDLPLVGPPPRIVIGGGGERVTLGIVARYADQWNYYGPAETLRQKGQILDDHCVRIGRNPVEIVRSVALQVIIRDTPREVRLRQQTVLERNAVPADEFASEAGQLISGSPDEVTEQIIPYVDAGFRDFVLMGPAPYDAETFERFYRQVLPSLS